MNSHQRQNSNSSPSASAALTRRTWLQATAGGVGLIACGIVPLLAQDPQLRDAIRQMVIMTGSELPERWEEPTTGLVEVILGYSKPLRALNLGEREPATFFQAR